MDYLIRLLRLDLEGGVLSLSFPVCQPLLWMAPNHFHFRVVPWTTPGSVSLVRDFTHDKSVPYLFSSPQQQTEILIHLLKQLAPVDEIRGVLYLVDLMRIFSPRIWEELQF